MKDLYLGMFARLFLVVASLAYTTMYFLKINLLSMLGFPILIRGFMLALGVSVAYLAFDRDFYLPFLGKCVMPTTTTQKQTTTTTTTVVKLDGLPANTNVVFWAAQSNKNVVPNPFDAYGNYANSGIAKTDEKGQVTIELNCPGEYIVSKFGIMNKQLPKHVHYRYEIPKYNGMFSRVHTKNIIC